MPARSPIVAAVRALPTRVAVSVSLYSGCSGVAPTAPAGQGIVHASACTGAPRRREHHRRLRRRVSACRLCRKLFAIGGLTHSAPIVCYSSGCAFCVCGSAGQQDVSRRGEAARPRQASSLAAERCPFVRLRRRSALQALRLQAALPPRRTHDARTTSPRCRRAVLTTAAQLRCNGGSESVQNLRFREGREARQAAARNGQAACCGECGGLTVQRKLPFRAETSMHGGGCR